MLEQFTYGTTFCGIEHVTLNGKEQINGLVLSKKKKELDLNNSFKLESIENLTDYLSPKQHLFLIINTNKVLFKSLNDVLESRQGVQQAFPNLKLEDFYYETYTSYNKTFVAICRKEDVHSILDSYKEKQYSIIGFSLGNLSISALENFVTEKQLTTSNASIQFEHQKVSDIFIDTIEKRKININGLELTNNSILPLAGILTYYTNNRKTISNFDQLVTDLKEKFKQQHVFNLGLKISLATIFVLLLLSFLLFTNYSTKIDHLNTTLALNKTQQNSLIKLRSEVQKKEKLIKDFSLASSKASWYLDQIGSAVPSTVTLSEIQWQPVTKKIKEQKPIEIEQYIIMIKGISTKGDDFSDWLSALEQLDWMEKVTIHDYGTGKNTKTTFELEITFS